MGSLDGAVEHDDATSYRQSHAGRLVQKWFDAMPAVPLELWSPTTIFEPLSPLAPSSPFFLSLLQSNSNKASGLSNDDDDVRRRRRGSGTDLYSPVLFSHYAAGPSSSLAAQGTFLSTPSRTSLVSRTSAGSEADTATTEASDDDENDDESDDGSYDDERQRGKMPSTIRAGPDDDGVFARDSFAAANGAANASHRRRPKSSRSAKSERSSSPLFRKAWPRAKHHNHSSKDEGAAGEGARLETPAALTPAEFDALPTAIQRKVRRGRALMCISSRSHPSTVTHIYTITSTFGHGV